MDKEDNYGMTRVALIGDSGVGKSSIVRALLTPYDKNWLYFPTVGCSVNVLSMDGPKLVRFEDEESADVPEHHFVELWDIGGNARYRAARKRLFAECEGLIFVWDAEHDRTFHALNSWLQDVLESSSDALLHNSEDEYFAGDEIVGSGGLRSRLQSHDLESGIGGEEIDKLKKEENAADLSSAYSSFSTLSPPSPPISDVKPRLQEDESKSSTGHATEEQAHPRPASPSLGNPNQSPRRRPPRRRSKDSLLSKSNKYSSGKLSTLAEVAPGGGEAQPAFLTSVPGGNLLDINRGSIDNSYSNRTQHASRYYIYGNASASTVDTSGHNRGGRFRADSLVEQYGIQSPHKSAPAPTANISGSYNYLDMLVPTASQSHSPSKGMYAVFCAHPVWHS